MVTVMQFHNSIYEYQEEKLRKAFTKQNKKLKSANDHLFEKYVGLSMEL